MEKKETPRKQQKKVTLFGYEYHLVECLREPTPAIFGMRGWALKSVNKIKYEDTRNN
jgi:hypothetical protein